MAIVAATDVLERNTVDIGEMSHGVEVDGGCYTPLSQRWGVTENNEDRHRSTYIHRYSSYTW